MDAFSKQLVLVLLFGWIAAANAQQAIPRLESVVDPDRRRELYGLSVLPPKGSWLVETAVQGHRLGFVRDLGQKTVKERHTAFAEVGYRWLDGCTEAAECLGRGIDWMGSGGDGMETVSFTVSGERAVDPHCVRFEAVQENRKAPGFGRRGFSSPAAGLLCTHPDDSTLFISLMYSERFRWGQQPAFSVVGEADSFVQSLQFLPLGARVVGITRLGPSAAGIAVGEDRIWVQHRAEISGISIDDGSILTTISSEVDGLALNYGAGALWVGHMNLARLTRIDPDSGKISARISLAGPVIRSLAAYGSIWARVAGGGVVRIDPMSNAVIHELRQVAGGGSLAEGHGSIWATSQDEHVYRIDPATNTISARIFACVSPIGVTATELEVWVACPETGQVVALNPVTNSVTARIHIGGSPLFLATDKDALWLTNRQHGTLSRVELDSHTLTSPIPLENGPFDVQVAFGSIWVTDRPSGTLFRVRP